MNWFRSIASIIFATSLGGSLSGILAQTSGAGIEQQLRSLYHLTKVGADGTVVGPAGSVLVIQPTATWSAAAQGLTALPASSGVYWYTTYDKEGRAKRATLQHGGTDAYVKYGHRDLQHGEKAYLTDLQIKPNEIAFFLQSCGVCDGSKTDPNNPPYLARLAFEFEKGYLSTADLRQVLEKTGRVLALDTSPPRQDSKQPMQSTAVSAPAPGRIVPLNFPSTYISTQAPADQLQLNADRSFSLQEAGQTYHGTFAVNGNNVEITIDANTKTQMTVQEKTLTDPSGQAWALREQPAPIKSSVPALRNEDIIKLAKVGIDDATIIAKIKSSNCQFDTSTDALIQLKESGVGAAVLKAMVGAGK